MDAAAHAGTPGPTHSDGFSQFIDQGSGISAACAHALKRSVLGPFDEKAAAQTCGTSLTMTSESSTIGKSLLFS